VGQANIGCFSGLNDADSPATLSPCESPDLLNVEANLGGTAILKRKGFTVTGNLSCSTCPVTGSHSFIDSSGNKLDIVCYNRYCAKSTNGNAFADFLTVAASSATRWSWVDQGGIAYGANNAYDPIIKYDGTTVSRPSGMPKGTILELNQDRLVVGDIEDNPNRVHRSSAGAYEQFTTGANPEDSFFDDIGAPGDKIRGIKCFNGSCYYFKTASITACDESDQYSTRCSVISPNLGTTDPASIVTAGSSLYFRAQDKNYWEFNRDGFRQISAKIPNLVKSQSGGLGGGENSNLQTTQADWQAGTQRPTGSWDTVTLPGSIFTSSSTLLDSTTNQLALGTFAGSGLTSFGHVGYAGVTSTYTLRYEADSVPNSDGWTWNGSGSQSVSGGSLTVTGNGYLASKTMNDAAGITKFFVFRAAANTNSTDVLFDVGPSPASGGPCDGVRFTNGTVEYGRTSFSESLATNQYSTFTVIVSSDNAYTEYWRNGVFKASHTIVCANIVKASIASTILSGTGHLFVDFIHASTAIASPGTASIVSGATFTSRAFDTAFSTPILSAISFSSASISDANLAFSMRSSTSPNDDMWTSFFSVGNGNRPESYLNRYVQYRGTFTHTNLISAPSFRGFTTQYSSTGTFTTQCIQPNSAINAWGTLNCAESLVGNGSLVYYATSAASCATLPAGDVTSWQTSVTNNATVSIATNTAVYIGWRSLLGSATDQAQVDACTLSWNEGTPSQPSWAVYDSVKNAVYWTTTINNAAYANRLLKYDRNLEAWFPFSIAAAAPRIINNSLYFGGSSSGTWAQYGLVDSDDGASIPAHWTSKDVGSDRPFQQKRFGKLSLLFRNNSSGSVTALATFSNAQTQSYSVSLSTGSGISYARFNDNLPSGTFHNFMKVRVGNESSTPFELLGLGIGWTVDPWKVGGP
jgi:hypothetical protein